MGVGVGVGVGVGTGRTSRFGSIVDVGVFFWGIAWHSKLVRCTNGVCLVMRFRMHVHTGIITRKGVVDPTHRDIYVPVLRELKNYKIDCVENFSRVDL
jgi:hypothetical protein